MIGMKTKRKQKRKRKNKILDQQDIDLSKFQSFLGEWKNEKDDHDYIEFLTGGRVPSISVCLFSLSPIRNVTDIAENFDEQIRISRCQEIWRTHFLLRGQLAQFEEESTT